MTDSLDHLLDRSAPAPADRGSARDAALTQMIADARETVRPPRRGRRMPLAVGIAAVALIGAAGVAAANSEWIWVPGLENPDRSYSYTAPTWGLCEIRFSGYDTVDPFVEGNVNRILDDWFARTDVEAAAEPYVAKHLAVIEESMADDAEGARDPRLPDLNAWTAHEQALHEAMHTELRSRPPTTAQRCATRSVGWIRNWPSSSGSCTGTA